MIEPFVLDVDLYKFRSTNDMWNRLMLNDPWSVGYVSTLIELENWSCKEDWEAFYYKSGQQRLSLLGSNASLLNNDKLQLNKSEIMSISYSLKNINTQYGRTKEELYHKGEILYNAVKNNGHNLSIDDCAKCVRFRTICETWNGIILRENNTVKTLQGLFPNLTFRKTEGERDHTYAVDYEVYISARLLCGIQIKPKSYTWNAPYIQKARHANDAKFQAYTNLHGVPVWNVISSNRGEIYNTEVIEQIRLRF